MKLIIGLGNPGSRYEKTRHNIGRRFIEGYGKSQGIQLHAEKSLQAEWGVKENDSGGIGIAFPLTYMNHSGVAVAKLVRKLELNPESDILILVDDVALPFGKLRLRGQGSDGGHNGLKSICQSLGTEGYSRLRAGVGLEEGQTTEESLEEYVLNPFDRDEEQKMDRFFELMDQACGHWLNGPISDAMNVVNTYRV